MRNNDNDVRDLMTIVNGCVGSVWLENAEGQKVDLKKDPNRSSMIEAFENGKASDFELYAAAREDVWTLINFMRARKAA